MAMCYKGISCGSTQPKSFLSMMLITQFFIGMQPFVLERSTRTLLFVLTVPYSNNSQKHSCRGTLLKGMPYTALPLEAALTTLGYRSTAAEGACRKACLGSVASTELQIHVSIVILCICVSPLMLWMPLLSKPEACKQSAFSLLHVILPIFAFAYKQSTAFAVSTPLLVCAYAVCVPKSPHGGGRCHHEPGRSL
eukprot:scaffold240275_cov19-Tisochrysis_lutea.AAC.4